MTGPVFRSIRSPRDAELPPVDTYAVVDGVLIGYRNGVEVWKAESRSFGNLVLALVQDMRERSICAEARVHKVPVRS